jgi:hypothetical protein
MNPIVAALLQRQGGQQGGMGGMPMQGQMPMGGMGMQRAGAPDTIPGAAPQLTLDQLNQMKLKGQALPGDWINQISQAERSSLSPQWSNG